MIIWFPQYSFKCEHDVLFNFLYASRKTKQNKFFKSDNWGRNYYMYYANIEEPRCDGVDRWNVTKLTRNRHVDELIMFTHFRKHGIFWWGKKINFYHLFKWIRLEYKTFLSETQTANWELGQTVIDRSCLQGNVESISRVKFVPQFRKLVELTEIVSSHIEQNSVLRFRTLENNICMFCNKNPLIGRLT